MQAVLVKMVTMMNCHVWYEEMQETVWRGQVISRVHSVPYNLSPFSAVQLQPYGSIEYIVVVVVVSVVKYLNTQSI